MHVEVLLRRYRRTQITLVRVVDEGVDHNAARTPLPLDSRVKAGRRAVDLGVAGEDVIGDELDVGVWRRLVPVACRARDTSQQESCICDMTIRRQTVRFAASDATARHV